MVTRKAGEPAPTARRGTQRGARAGTDQRRALADPPRPRARGHSLAPDHLGEIRSVAVVAVAILGVALLITGAAMAIDGITIGSRFSGATPPPNLGSLGLGQIAGGAGLGALAVLLIGTAAATFAGVRRARLLTAASSALSAALCVAGVIVVAGQIAPDPMLGGALSVSALLFAVSAIILARRR